MKTSNRKENNGSTREQSEKTRNKRGATSTRSQSNTIEKDRIYNVIIVDESGSMSFLRNATVEGVNETIKTIKESQVQYEDNQVHYLTMVTFSGANNNSIRTIIDGAPITKVTSFDEYNPYGSTPLYDAVGDTLTSLHNRIKDDKHAIGSVTILTDGEENASQKWDAKVLKSLIARLKEEGWQFSYMGSDHNVKNVTDRLSIDNALEFSHDTTGASNTWERERASKQEYFRKMHDEYRHHEAREEKIARMKRYNQEYYHDRVTREHIRHLEPNEVFVFGSNADGFHSGGASALALRHFGAVMGVGEGIQGQSYAIPTTSGLQRMTVAVERFCEYARQHPRQKFLVTRVGCGAAGFSDSEVAPLFRPALSLENVSLPMEFWAVLGLRML